MFLQSVYLQGFRSFADKNSFQLHPKFTLIIGPNSVGKTNLLEALYCLSYGQGFREKKTDELINQKHKDAVLEAILQNQSHSDKLLLRLHRLDGVVTKTGFVNQMRRSLRDFLKRSLNAVLFQPDDLLIISHTPDLRRGYFDKVLGSVDFGYLQARRNYSRGLYKRNKLLENSQNLVENELINLIGFWDDYLAKQAKLLQDKRQAVVADFNQHMSLNGLDFKIEYQPNRFLPAQEKTQFQQELRVRRTLSGPQLDEFVFYKLNHQPKVLSQYGSRSEQRLCVLWLKINELRFIEQQTGQKPILLMDDIFSELDLENSRRILQVAKEYQTVVTTAHQDILPLLKRHTKELSIITLSP